MGNDQQNHHNIILFDGVCNLCNGTVNFVIDHDPKGTFKFSALQSDIGKNYIEKFAIDTAKTDSIILIEKDQAYIKSTAALRIAKKLSGAYPLLYGFIIIPTFIRNMVYNWIAKNRYKWFGKSDACRIPTPELTERFL